MKDKIKKELFDLERHRPIHIINARERGSRMLGASHAESDWDVLFLFAQDAAEYAKLGGDYINSIHEPHLGDDDHIDLHGWNIDKFAGLLHDSNPNAIEYCIPSKQYITYNTQAWNRMMTDAIGNFNHMSLYHHYISMAKRNWKKYIDSGNDRTKGRQFYVARAIACAQHIRRDGTLPPMDAMELADDGNLSEQMAGILRKLTKAKQAGHGEQENPDITGPLYHAESEAPMEPSDERINDPDRELINAFIENAVVR